MWWLPVTLLPTCTKWPQFWRNVPGMDCHDDIVSTNILSLSGCVCGWDKTRDVLTMARLRAAPYLLQAHVRVLASGPECEAHSSQGQEITHKVDINYSFSILIYQDSCLGLSVTSLILKNSDIMKLVMNLSESYEACCTRQKSKCCVSKVWIFLVIWFCWS